MTEVTNKEDEAMEGSVEIPNARRRSYRNAKELGEWLVLTNPKTIQVTTERTQQGIRYVLLTQEP